MNDLEKAQREGFTIRFSAGMTPDQIVSSLEALHAYFDRLNRIRMVTSDGAYPWAMRVFESFCGFMIALGVSSGIRAVVTWWWYR